MLRICWARVKSIWFYRENQIRPCFVQHQLANIRTGLLTKVFMAAILVVLINILLVFMLLSYRRYNISWSVDSHSPIEEYKLFFRRLPDDHELDNTIEQPSQPVQHSHGSHFQNSYRNPYGNHWTRNDWRDVILPAMPPSHLFTQSMSYMIRGLDPDQQYEAKVQAK